MVVAGPALQTVSALLSGHPIAQVDTAVHALRPPIALMLATHTAPLQDSAMGHLRRLSPQLPLLLLVQEILIVVV
jgi:hypothetical protein